MFSSFSLPFQLPNLGFNRRNPSLILPSVNIHDVETDPEKSARTLKHLLKINHTNHSIIYHDLHFHNHTPHILGSAYILGATTPQLNHIYEEESKSLEPWTDAPGEISRDDWRDFLGKRNYQRAFIDFFEDQLVRFGYDLKKLMDFYLFEGDEPLVNSLISGLGHPLIHLGYAYELSSRTVSIEALGLVACFYDDLHKYIDDPAYTRPSSYRTTSVFEILEKVAKDDRFANLFDHQGSDNIDTLLEENEDAVLDHWNAWELPSSPEELKSCFAEAQRAAVALVVATNPPASSATTSTSTSVENRHSKEKYYDFFLVHLLTSSHAIRILLPLVPSKFQVPLLRQWLFFTLSAYIGQSRPRINMSLIEDYNVAERGWKYVKHMGLTSEHATDAHYVKALRAMLVAEETWGENDQYWLKAAVRMASEFEGWGGFDSLTKGYKPKT